MVRQLEVVGVRLEVPANQPIVLLKDASHALLLPIWIGANEANAIVMAQEGVQPPRPMTHDLLVSVLAATDERLAEVVITELVEGVFYAVLRLSSGVDISARPSDAIAVALRTETPVFATDEVMEEAGVPVPAEDDEVVAQFKEFLDHIEPEDFEKRGPGEDSGTSDEPDQQA